MKNFFRYVRFNLRSLTESSLSSTERYTFAGNVRREQRKRLAFFEKLIMMKLIKEAKRMKKYTVYKVDAYIWINFWLIALLSFLMQRFTRKVVREQKRKKCVWARSVVVLSQSFYVFQASEKMYTFVVRTFFWYSFGDSTFSKHSEML